MNEQSRVLVASLAGAAIGGLVGYLYFTGSGRRLREQLEPRLDECAREIRRLRSTVDKAQAVASEGWRALNELVGERPQGAQSSGQLRQSSPF
jgi:gas vesicle protein